MCVKASMVLNLAVTGYIPWEADSSQKMKTEEGMAEGENDL